jgi:glycosyltransferase involved in cell wall biosynthesis
MRILQVVARYYPELQYGGPPQKVHALSRGLAGRGHQVRVVTLHSTRRAGGAVDQDGIEVHYLPWLGRGTWQAPLGAGALAAAIRQSDVVHCYGLYNLLCPAAAFLAGRVGRPFVLEPLGMYLPRTRSLRAKRLYHLIFTSWLGRRAARVIATSPGEKEELAGLVEPERLVVRRNGIDLELFQALPPVDRFRAAHGIADGERVILYMGRISPIKNLEQLVQAFSAAALEGARLALVGPALEPAYARRLADLIAGLGLEGRVLLTGPLYGEAKLEALGAADLFVLPSLMESYGNAAAEAVAAGVPVLLTDACGIAPQIHGRAGMAVPVGAASLAEGLRAMIEDGGLRDSLTARRGEVLQELSWDEPLAQTEQMYETLLRDAGR